MDAAERIKPTVILQDLVMPDVDGLSLVRAYRAHAATRQIPIVVLSAKEEPTVKSDAFAAGANDYLVKLPDRIELVARVRFHSRAYLNQIQRDEAYRALRESQRQLTISNATLAERIAQLEDALSKVKQLSGLLPICSYCKCIRTDHDYWQRVDHYLAEHANVQFSHGICPSCFKTLAAELDG
jgi:PleD family two-component response regulator